MYMSPEQILDQPLDSRTDIYSFGIVMYEMLAGRPLFGGKQITEVMSKHVNIKPQPLAAAVPNVIIPLPLDAAVRKCLEKSREARFQSFADLKEQLNFILANLDGEIKEEIRRRQSQQAVTGEVTQPARPQPPAAVVSPVSDPQPSAAKAGAGAFAKSRNTGTGISSRSAAFIALAVLAVLCAGGAYAYWQSKQCTDREPAVDRVHHNKQGTNPTHHAGGRDRKSPGTRTKPHTPQTGSKQHESNVHVMNAIEKGYLEHNSGSEHDAFKGAP
jgi:hypothetical protein